MIVTASPNIAFIKYWGKLDARSDDERNLPCNPSLSMTLAKAQTTTDVEALPRSASEHRITLGDTAASALDVEKISRHLARICAYAGADADTRFRVASRNNFPQGTGLASSASAYAALSLAGIGALLGPQTLRERLSNDLPNLSALARKGSGSACRSLEGPFVKWEHDHARKTEHDFRLYDTILIFSNDHKKVPSSEGHLSAQSSPLFAQRLAQVPARMAAMLAALASHSLEKLGPLLETEALELHEIAHGGKPSITYLTAESRRFINLLRSLRERDFYFTLDAGPNVHLISEAPIGNKIARLLESHGFRCEIWEDEQGRGPLF